jgi:hypothetical protein
VKLPDVKFSKPSLRGGPNLSKPDVKPPKFAVDLYADLRDRRLLPLVLLLVVAIVATPILLAGGGDDTPAEAPPIAAVKPPAQASFSVVPAASALRSYRKRLGYREARDPFATPHAGRESGAESGEGSEANSGEGAAGSEEAVEEAAPPAVTSPTETAVESPSSTPVEETHTQASVVIQNKVIGYGIDARLGYLGHVKLASEIRPMTKLPNAKHPVVVYVGPNEDKTGAVFLMTTNVSAFYGKGRCKLGGQACQLLELKAGKSATFAYGYGNARYKVQLNKVLPIVSTVHVEAHVHSHH